MKFLFTLSFACVATVLGQTPNDESAAVLQAADGNFYGTSQGGGTGWGTVFKMTPAGALTTGGPAQPGTLVSIFCIPPSFTQTVDAAADLPGPGAVAIPGMAQALP